MPKPFIILGCRLDNDILLSAKSLEEILKKDLSQIVLARSKQESVETLEFYINDLIGRLNTLKME